VNAEGPLIAELVVISDGFVPAAREGDTGANHLISDCADFDGNLVALLSTAPNLTKGEVALFGHLQRARINRW
jgi:hypothetical protein